MQTKQAICLVAIILVSVALGWTLHHIYDLSQPKHIDVRTIYIPQYKEKVQECGVEKEYIVEYRRIYLKPEWEELLLNFSMSHEYDKHDYNCVDFSRDAVKELRRQGYMAYQMKGYCKGIGHHAWVEIRLWYDVQSVQQLDPKKCRVNL